MSTDQGVVYLVGAGPGDPGLFTRKGEELLARAEVVIYDHLASPRLLDLAPPEALRICAGKSIGHCTLSQSEINETLVEHAQAGKRVVRLKGGDPFVFGRGGEEAEHLRAAGIRFEVVPGVTAGVGVTAYAGIPITHRDSASAVAFITGHNGPNAEGGRLDWQALAQFPGTLVIYMGVTRLEAICHTLVKHGKPDSTPAALIESGTLPGQRTVAGTLATLPALVKEAGLGPPALLVVGDVVRRRSSLQWFEDLPLFGQRILITRPQDSAGTSAKVLERLGAEVLVAPTVEIRPLDDFSELDRTIARLAEFQWLVFTSVNGVQAFFDRIEALDLDLRAVGHMKFAAIGPATAEALRRYHLRADVVPESFRSEALAEALAERVRGTRVLLARATRGRVVLKEELLKVAEVEQIAVYQNVDADRLPESVMARLVDGSIDWITLTSSAITGRLHEVLGPELRERIGRTIKLASLSPVTTETASKLGWSVAAEASQYTWDGLVEAIVQASAINEKRRP